MLHLSISSRRAWIEPLLLALALALWFGYELGSRALWSPDEGRYAEIPREMAQSGDFLTPRLNGVKYLEKPPLMYWLVAGAIKAFGLNEWALRLWPALFALAGCMTVYFFGRWLYDARAGLFAAVVLAVSPLYDFLGAALTLDMALTALLTAALSAFFVGIRTPPGVRRRFWFYGFYAAVAFAVLTKGLVGIVVPAIVIGAWIVILGEWRLLREMYLVSGTLVFLALAAPWHVLVSQANPEFAQFYFIHEHLQRYLTTVHQRYKPAWFFVLVLFAGMYPWSALLPYALRQTCTGLWRERHKHRDTWFLMLWAVLPFLFFSLSDSKLAPYILPVLPPLALLLGRWFAHDWERRIASGREGLLLLVLGAVLAALLIAGVKFYPERAGVVDMVVQFGSGLYIMAGALLLAGALPFAAHFFGGRRETLIALFVGAIVLVGTFDLNLSRLDVGRSVKDLALALKNELKPGDEVMTYGEYYQDLPVYLERRITVVNWGGELEFGTTIENTRAWMIDLPTFRQRWREPRTIYLLTSPASYNTLRTAPPGPMCVVHATQRAVLAVNKECGS